MAQFARPDSVVTAGTWTGNHTAIDETTPSDADFVFSQNNPNDTFEVGLSDVTDPASSSGHVLRVRLCRGDADGTTPATNGTATNYALDLVQNTTVIASVGTTAAPTSWTTVSLTLSGAEADAITDYTDLRVRITASGGGGSAANRRDVAVSWVELETPNAPTGGSYTLNAVLKRSVASSFTLNAVIATNQFTDDFETGDLSKWDVVNQGGANDSVTVVSGSAHEGSFGMKVTEAVDGTATHVRKNNLTTNRIRASGWFRSPTEGPGGNNNANLRIFSGSTRIADVYRQNVTGELWLRTFNSSSTQVFTSTGQTRSTNVWYHFDVLVEYNGAGAVSHIQVRVDGVSRIDASTFDLFAGGFTFVQVGAEHPNQYVDLDVDEIFIDRDPSNEQTGSFTFNATLRRVEVYDNRPRDWVEVDADTTIDVDDILDLVYADGRWVGVGGGGGDAHVVTATHASGPWTKTGQGLTTFSKGSYFNGKWVVIGIDGTTGIIAIADDPTGTWTVVQQDATRFYTNLSVGVDGVNIPIVFVSAQDNQLLLSKDFGDWFPHTGPLGSTENYSSVAYGNGVWVAVAGGGKIITTLASEVDESSANWVEQTSPFGGTNASDVVYGNGIWVAVAGTKIATATDPEGTWTLRTSNATSSITQVTYHNGVFVAVTQVGEVLVATDPTQAWSATDITALSLEGIGGAGTTWLAGSDSGQLYYGHGGLALDAILKKTTSLTFSLDAVIPLAGGTGSFTADAILEKSQSGSFAFNSILKRSTSGSFTLDAVVRRSVPGSFSLDAIVFRTQTTSATLNAVIRRAVAESLTLDAAFVQTVTTPFTLAAILRRTETLGAALDAVVLREQVASLALDAVTERIESADVTLDAWILRTETQNVTLDAVILASAAATTTLDAIVERSASAAFVLDAWLRRVESRSATLDATFFKTTTASFDLSAVVMPFATLDAVLLRTEAADFAFDAVIMPVVTLDAIVRRTETASTTLNAFIAGVGVAAFSLDAVLRAQQAEDFAIDAVVLRTISPDFTIDSVVFRTENASFSTDAIAKRTTTATLTLDAALLRDVSASFSLDAVQLKTSSAGITADAVVRAPRTAGFTLDSVVLSLQQAAATLDAVLQTSATADISLDAVITVADVYSFTLDAITLASEARSFTLDSIQQTSSNEVFTLDALVRSQAIGAATIDAIVLRPELREASFDAVVQAGQAGSFELSALISELRSATFDLDAMLSRPVTAIFSAEAILKKIVERELTADAVLRTTHEGSLLLDAYVAENVVKSFQLDASLVATHIQSFVTAAYLILPPSDVVDPITAVISADTITSVLSAEVILGEPEADTLEAI